MNGKTVVIQITSQHSGLRLDRVDLPGTEDLSRSRIQALIHSGHIQVNGKSVKPSCILKMGDTITCFVPEPIPLQLIPEDLPIDILYEDSDVIVVDKPRGLVVHPGAGIKNHTLVNALLHICSDLSGIGGTIRPGIVHRLDKGTSGVIIAAKNDRAHLSLSNQFSSRTMEKEYLALAFGQPSWKEKYLEEPVGRDPQHRVKMAVTSSGRPARTRFKLQAYGKEGFLVSAFPSSGRTHQIRVHLDYLNHPILGDPLYGLPEQKRLPGYLQKALKMMDGFCLHSRRLVFDHPSRGERLEITADLPEDFKRVMESLRMTDAWKTDDIVNETD